MGILLPLLNSEAGRPRQVRRLETRPLRVNFQAGPRTMHIQFILKLKSEIKAAQLSDLSIH
jgi:hypothetical protein